MEAEKAPEGLPADGSSGALSSAHLMSQRGHEGLHDTPDTVEVQDRKDGCSTKEVQSLGSRAVAAQPACQDGRKTAAVLFFSLVVLAASLSFDLDPQKPNASKGAAVLLITALWLFTPVIPLTIASLLPMVLCPLLGVAKAKDLSQYFVTGTSFVLISVSFIGLAVERWDLHKRVVCSIVAAVGRRAELLIAGFMFSVWLLSMCISGAATILCVLPIAQAFLATLPRGHENFERGFLLAMGYSATIGGMGTPLGTLTNGIFMDQFSAFWPSESEFSFARFSACALPLSMLLLLVVWLGVCSLYVWRNRRSIPVDRELFRRMHADMGKVSFEQAVVALDLFVLVVLLFTASPVNSFPGWRAPVAAQLNSGAIGVALTLPLFFVPCAWRLPSGLRRALGEERCSAGKEAQNILDWHAVKGNFKWELLFVYGGGMMIAHGTVASELAQWIAERLSETGLGAFGFIFIATLIICFVTEFISSLSMLATFGSIIATTAQLEGHNQVQLLLAVTFAASFAFMLPMAGGPNMVVYSTGKVSLRFMVMNGVLLNLAACLVGSAYMAYGVGLLDPYEDLPPPEVVS